MAETTPKEMARSGRSVPAVQTLTPDTNLRGADTAMVDHKAKRVEMRNVDLYYGEFHAVKNVSMTIEPNKVTALIGSSGCGKTTVLRSINRMHELTPGARVQGGISLDDQSIYGR